MKLGYYVLADGSVRYGSKADCEAVNQTRFSGGRKVRKEKASERTERLLQGRGFKRHE